MAKVFGPALAIDAKGKIGKGVAYQGRPKGTVFMKNPSPGRHSLDNPSAAQQIQRNAIASLISQWQALTPAERYYWDYLAEQSGLNIKGYHYFMKKKAAFLVLEDGLVLYLPFRYGSGCLAADYSGFKNNGILKPSCPANCPSWVNSKNEKFGKALSFDGVDDYVDIGQPSSLNVNYITVMAWVKFNGHIANQPTIAGRDNGNQRNWAFYQLTSTTLRFFVFASNVGISKDHTFTPTLGQWYHLAGTADGNHVRIYIDGVDVGTPTAYSGVIDKDVVDTQIGSDLLLAHLPFDGLIDEVRIYNRALTPAEIKEYYNLLK